MTENIWYHAYYDEIWAMETHGRIIRGCQAIIEIEGAPSVPDYLELYSFKVDMKKWRFHVKNGWLVRL